MSAKSSKKLSPNGASAWPKLTKFVGESMSTECSREIRSPEEKVLDLSSEHTSYSSKRALMSLEKTPLLIRKLSTGLQEAPRQGLPERGPPDAPPGMPNPQPYDETEWLNWHWRGTNSKWDKYKEYEIDYAAIPDDMELISYPAEYEGGWDGDEERTAREMWRKGYDPETYDPDKDGPFPPPYKVAREPKPDDLQPGLTTAPAIDPPRADPGESAHSNQADLLQGRAKKSMEAIPSRESGGKWFLHNLIGRILPGAIGVPKPGTSLPKLPAVRHRDLEAYESLELESIYQAIEDGHKYSKAELDDPNSEVSKSRAKHGMTHSRYQTDFFENKGFPQCFIRARDIGELPRYGTCDVGDVLDAQDDGSYMLILQCGNEEEGDYFETMYIPVRMRDRLTNEVKDVYVETMCGNLYLPRPSRFRRPEGDKWKRRDKAKRIDAEAQAQLKESGADAQTQAHSHPPPPAPCPKCHPRAKECPEGPPPRSKSPEVSKAQAALTATLSAGHKPTSALVEEAVGKPCPKITAPHLQSPPAAASPPLGWGRSAEVWSKNTERRVPTTTPSAVDQWGAKPAQPVDSNDPWASAPAKASTESPALPRRADEPAPGPPSPPPAPPSGRAQHKPAPAHLEQSPAKAKPRQSSVPKWHSAAGM